MHLSWINCIVDHCHCLLNQTVNWTFPPLHSCCAQMTWRQETACTYNILCMIYLQVVLVLHFCSATAKYCVFSVSVHYASMLHCLSNYWSALSRKTWSILLHVLCRQWRMVYGKLDWYLQSVIKFTGLKCWWYPLWDGVNKAVM